MSILLSFKRVLHKASLWVMAAIVAVCILLCGALTGDDGIPDCGFVSGSDPLALEICDILESDGLVRYDSAEELTDAIQKGVVASGMVFPDDFSERVYKDDLKNAITYYECERVMISPLYKYRTAAYIIERYIPHLVSKLLSDEGVTLSPEDAEKNIDGYIASNAKFEFTVESADGIKLDGEHYSMGITMGAVSLLLFFALSIFALPYSEKHFLPIAKRVGLGKALKTYAFGSVLCVMLLFFALTSAALTLSDILFASGAVALIPPLAVYIIFLSALCIAATAIFGSTEKIRVPVMALCLASLAVCPIFIDIAEFFDIPMWIRHLVPAYFFYTARENLAVCAAIAASMFAFACALYAFCLKKKLHR